MSYDYFRDAFVVAAGRSYEPGQQVRVRLGGVDRAARILASRMPLPACANPNPHLHLPLNHAPPQKVFVSYGIQSNDSLMQFYGFAEPSNPADTYVMVSLLKWLEQLAAPPPARLAALSSAGLADALQDVVVTRQGFAPRTLQVMARGAASMRLPL